MLSRFLTAPELPAGFGVRSLCASLEAVLARLRAKALPLFFFVAVTSGFSAIAEPLRVHPTNPRYFTDGAKNQDGTLKAVFLTGSHTWANLIDRGPSDPPPVFDFTAYLDFLQTNNHNFIRLWTRHVTWYHRYGDGELRAGPLAWARSGPGLALDGKPKFDLAKLNDAYFTRLRERVGAASARGIYVSVMLFGGSYECRGGWRGNPLHSRNNINDVNGDPNGDGHGLESHTLQIPEVVRLQETYVRKVIDTVNEFDNVLYEIANEGDGSSYEWQCHFVRFIRDCESKKPKQHPIGMTALYVDDAKEGNQRLVQSPADWISTQVDARGVRDIQISDPAKVNLLDSDHWFVKELYNDSAFGREWVWKSFLRGHNPILMEHLPPLSLVDKDYPLSFDDPGYTASRIAMGRARQLAQRINLGAMTPRNDLASSGFSLAKDGVEYVVYAPAAQNELIMDIPEGQYACQWMDAVSGELRLPESLKWAGGRKRFPTVTESEAILHIKRASP